MLVSADASIFCFISISAASSFVGNVVYELHFDSVWRLAAPSAHGRHAATIDEACQITPNYKMHNNNSNNNYSICHNQRCVAHRLLCHRHIQNRRQHVIYNKY